MLLLPARHKALRTLVEPDAFRVVGLDFVQFDDACPGGGRNGGDTDCGAPGKQALVMGVASGRYRSARRADRAARHIDAGRFDRRYHRAAMPPGLKYTAMRLVPWREPGLRAMGNFHD